MKTGSSSGRAGLGRLAARLFRRGAILTGLFVAGCQSNASPAVQSQSSAAPKAQPATPNYSVRTQIGFTSRKHLDEHFVKHGGEFTGMSKADYLVAAQTLRDRPAGGDVEEISRPDGTTSRFDKESGAFIAFDSDGTIRTFFKPNDGERYFRRQAERSH